MTCRTFYCLYIVVLSLLQTALANDITPNTQPKISAHKQLNNSIQSQPFAPFYEYLGSNQEAFYQHLLTQCLGDIAQQKNTFTCDEYPYLGKPRKVTARFQNHSITLIEISVLRDYMAYIVNELAQEYGQPTRENIRFSYYQPQGVCVDFAKATISLSIHVKSKSSENTICANNKNLAINTSITSQQWLADLTQLNEIITQQHVIPFWLNTESNYQAIMNDAKHYFQQDTIESDIAFSYFEKMIAHLADGHAYIANKTVRFGILPIKFSWYGDDLIVTKIEPKHHQLLGAKVTHINGKTIDDVMALIKPYVPAVNQSGFKGSSQSALKFIGLLYAAKITEQNNAATFQFMLKNGDSTQLTIQEKKAGIKSQLVSLSTKINPNARLFCQKSAKRQCVEYLPKHNAVYLRYKSVMEDAVGDIKKVSDEMSALIKAHQAERLIVDVRNNDGGNSYLNSYLLNAIISNKAINQQGKLYLLTNHNTFSAAINFTGTLVMNSHVIIVGQPVGDAPIFPGEAGPQAIHLLPNTNALVSVSFSHWQTTFLYDQQLHIPVDIAVKSSIENTPKGDYDEVLNTALTYKVTPQLAENVTDELASGLPLPRSTPLSAQEQETWLGRYSYSHDKALVITAENNRLTLTVEGEITADLSPINKKRLQLSTGHLFIEKQGEHLALFQNGVQVKKLSPLRNNEYKPLELFLQGDFAQAKMAYQRVYKNMPTYLPLSGNNLGLLASKLSVKYDDKNLYQQMREIAIALHGYPIKSWEGANNENKQHTKI